MAIIKAGDIRGLRVTQNEAGANEEPSKFECFHRMNKSANRMMPLMTRTRIRTPGLLLWLISLVVLPSSRLQAQAGNAGATGLAFLKIGIGGQSVALGEAAAALVQDASAVYWNPAGLNFANNQVYFAHTEWLQDIRNEFLAVKFSAAGWQVGLFGQLQSIDGIEQRDRPSEIPTSIIQARDVAFGVSLARKLAADFWGGVTLKYIGERIWTYAANGMAADLGVLWKPTWMPGISLAASLHNLGRMEQVRYERVRLPAMARLALAYRPDVFGNRADVAVVAGLRKVFSGGWNTGLGAESVLGGRFALRLGYRMGSEIQGVSAGIGVLGTNYRLDYAYAPLQLDFGNVHQISFSLSL